MTNRRLTIEVPSGESAVTFRRFVDAPPDLVFAVWTEPEHLRNWWGPRQVELVVCESDPRAGGRFGFVQRAPDRQEHTFHGVYREVARPHRLVRTFVYAGAPDDESVETVTFQRDGRGTLGTLITSTSVFPLRPASSTHEPGWRLGCVSLTNASTSGLRRSTTHPNGANDEQACRGRPRHAWRRGRRKRLGASLP